MSFLAAGVKFLPQVISGIGAMKAARVKPAKKAPAIPMPDEEMIEQKKRRSAGSRRSGRASTILTGSDYGLGG